MPPLNIPQQLLAAQHALQTGQLPLAAAILREILQQEPNEPEAYRLLAYMSHQTGHLQTAAGLLERSVELAPQNPLTLTSLAETYRLMGRLADAEATCRRALAIDPNFPDAFLKLAAILNALARHDETIALLAPAIEKNPNFLHAYDPLGNAYAGKRDFPKAIAIYRKGLALDPTLDHLTNNLALALYKNNQADQAVPLLQNLLRKNPDNPLAHFNLALSLLHLGQLPAGFDHYEWRWKCPDFQNQKRPSTEPLWEGQDLTGKSILLHAEQGFGDSIQFIRYVPLLAQRVGSAGSIFLEAQPAIKHLLEAIPGLTRTFLPNQTIPPCDYQCPLISLPRAFHTDLTTIPASVPYLSADPAKVAHWKSRIAHANKSLHVGLVWAGRPEYVDDRARSCFLAHFAPLGEIPNLLFYSLQKGSAASQLDTAPFPIQDLAPDLHDFTDTAALITNLDLVITVDTAPAHLAGALAKPVWNLLAYSSTWQWLQNRNDSPWYPTMRLFRQPRLHDWPSLFATVAPALREWAAARAP